MLDRMLLPPPLPRAQIQHRQLGNHCPRGSLGSRNVPRESAYLQTDFGKLGCLHSGTGGNDEGRDMRQPCSKILDLGGS